MYMLNVLLTAFTGASALPFTSWSPTTSVTEIYQFPQKDHWFENLAVRADGKILATELTEPKLWLIDPAATTSSNIELIHELPQYLGLLGIVEYRPDVFAFIAGNFSIPDGFISTPGTYAIWSVDFANSANVEKIADVPGANFLNGMAYLGSDDSLLLGDAGLGLVWKLDLATKTSNVAITDPLMHKVNAEAPDGINGLKVYRDELWFTRGFDAIVAKMQISDNGAALGPARIVGTGLNDTWTMDDLIVNTEGEAFVAIPFQNALARYGGNGAQPVVIAGNINSTEIAEPTSLAFGRDARGMTDEGVIYVATGGAIADPIDGSITVGGQLLRIQW